MSNTITAAFAKPKLSVKIQTLATLGAIIAAVALPQLFHAVGALSGLGTVPGEIFLPMHLPIILVGLLAGPFAGAIAGFTAPLISFAVSGMPGAAMLPFMMIELCVYGLSAGFLRNAKMPSVAKVVISQVAGRILRAAAILIAVYALGNSKIAVATIWTSIAAGLPGLILQWALIPLIDFRISHITKNEQ